jgi:disulfide bond formation protein DsbB
MLAILDTLNYWQALGVIFLQLAAIGLGAAFILRRKNALAARLIGFFTPKALWIAFVLALFASFMTLVYSDYLGIEPCPLCWWQRIFLYPQVIILGMAAWKRDRYVAEYSIVLSLFGAGIALYQHFLQMFPGSGLPCPATGASCAQRFLFEFGYITYPLMAFTLFAFLIITLLIVRSRRAS